ncbi:tRNA guanylyltransferase, putative [Ichthyophthirius multifiliis]|uniref:tRNA(His) guanylyltransferase n=1 Tax=Ichthyophthirius multifiliis TaxID=5932 RepID=G0QTR9_ICHMU|nr:tRNA guanylyltransferase, putative [Ichthyophthirius multifiliis]EGR31390.1 tRNA guanylyltransferase, putative [Ichthyophthirius multifiliis]|eukprot:XP_004034876.1 tRNA guanylyltransferase, putative [Ichthyophthirius multifiliis]
MACSQYEYVKKFENSLILMPNTYIVVRIDGKGFTKFTQANNFQKPNDKKGLNLMNKAAEVVMKTFAEICLAYGQSDEFSFVFSKSAQLYQRRADKIISCLVSCFTSAYVMNFELIMEQKCNEIPMFDGRAVCYPDFKNLRDYLSWRQVDCHINNLYNTCFWNMVLIGGKTNQEAQNILKDTDMEKHAEIIGTEGYMAPELYKKKHYCPKSVDIFASGVLLFCLVCGRPPFVKATDQIILVCNSQNSIFVPIKCLDELVQLTFDFYKQINSYCKSTQKQITSLSREINLDLDKRKLQYDNFNNNVLQFSFNNSNKIEKQNECEQGVIYEPAIGTEQLEFEDNYYDYNYTINLSQ